LFSCLPQGGQEIHGDLLYHMGWATESGKPLEAPQGQGKALRPTLCLFVCDALGGDWAQALPAAAALELIHNFSLIHDDIQDQDRKRRHRPTLWSLRGQPRALVSGDAMHGLAYRVALDLAQRGVSHEKSLAASRLLVESSLSMIKGQCLDLSFEGTLDVSLDEYLGMIRLKTGALITCSLEIGALLATDDEDHVRAFARYGDHLGRVFQVRDDVLGIWGKAEETGKASGNDIRRRKKSFPIVYALAKSSGSARQNLTNIYEKEALDGRDVDSVLGILEDVGAQTHAQALIEEEASRALGELEGIPLSPWARSETQSLVDFLVHRDH